ncbi:MAG: GNAT family N-acetyltransferase [Pseudomonadota bacterium]
MTPEVLGAVMEATWPPLRAWGLGPFTLRDGAGGGKRVSAASVSGAWDAADLDAAEAAMADPLFLIRAGDAALDAALAGRGYRIVDPVLAYAAPVARLAANLPAMVAFPHWPPLGIARLLWADAGTGPARLAVMDRVRGPKTVILARLNDRPAGVCFVALAGAHAMLHALEVSPLQRRQGLASQMLRAAANWAQDQGAVTLSLVVTAQNSAANCLYQCIGMDVVGRYQYRMR